MSEWYQLKTDEVLERLQTDPEKGLSEQEAQKRLDEYGINELVEKGGRSPLLILWDQMRDLMVIVLLVAAIVVLIFYKLIKLSFEIIFFVVLPSVLSAFILTFVLPYNFFYLLPATAAVFTLGLVLRTVGLSKG